MDIAMFLFLVLSNLQLDSLAKICLENLEMDSFSLVCDKYCTCQLYRYTSQFTTEVFRHSGTLRIGLLLLLLLLSFSSSNTPLKLSQILNLVEL